MASCRCVGLLLVAVLGAESTPVVTFVEQPRPDARGLFAPVLKIEPAPTAGEELLLRLGHGSPAAAGIYGPARAKIKGGYANFSAAWRPLGVRGGAPGEYRLDALVLDRAQLEAGVFESLLTPFQQIDTTGATAVVPFTAGGRTFLGVANHYDGSTRTLKSDIYALNDAQTAFKLFQQIDTMGARSMAAFTAGGRTFLGVANAYDGITYKIKSDIYEIHFRSARAELVNVDVRCSLCPAGYTCPSSSQSHPCPAGYMCVAGARRACPAGKHQASTRQSICLDCAPGQYQGTAGRATCDDCPAGTFRATIGASSARDCAPCPSGKYDPLPRAPACGDCPANAFSALDLVARSITRCQSCPGGTYSEEGAAHCKECERGRFRNASVVGSCIDCGAGDKPIANRTACAPYCRAGHFCQYGLELPCAVGRFQDATNATSCQLCGTCENGLARDRCSGTFEGICTPCAPGSFVNVSARSCTPCPVMHYSGISNAAKCTACEADKYQTEQGKTFCNAKTQCIPGEYVAQPLKLDASRCGKCLVMHYSNVTNAAQCERCPGGKYQDVPGQPFCETCSEGFTCAANTTTGVVELQQCPQGMQCSGASMELCVNQISNPATGKCISCEDKHFANTDTNNCTECPRLFEGSSALVPGVECSGGSISFKDDFFVVPDGSAIGPHTTTLRCRDPGACTTSVDLTNFTALTVCQGSTTGALCGACEDGYAKGAPGSPCVKCAADGGAAPVLLLLAALLLFGFLYRQCIKFALKNAREGHKSKFMTFSLLKIGMAYVRLGVRAAIAARWCLSNPLCSSRSPTPTLTPTPGSSSRRRCSRALTSTGAPSWASSSESTPSRAAATRPQWRRPSASASTCTRRRS